MLNRKLIVPATALAACLAACGAEEPSVITSVGDEAGIRLFVSCSPDGVVAVDSEFGGPGNQDSWLVGDGPGVEAMGGRSNLSKSFGLSTFDSADLVLNVAPVEGVCEIRLTDRVGGESLVRDTKSGKDFTLTAELRRN